MGIFHGVLAVFWLSVIVGPGTVKSQSNGSVTLTSSLKGNTTYHQQRITFTCIARGTGILAWHSEQYVRGTPYQILALSGDTCTDRSSYPDTIASWVGFTNGSGEMILESKLLITASVQHPKATVTCENVGDGKNASITFETTMLPCCQECTGTCASIVISGTTTLPDNSTPTGGITEMDSSHNIGLASYSGAVSVFLIISLIAIVIYCIHSKYRNDTPTSNNTKDAKCIMDLVSKVCPKKPRKRSKNKKNTGEKEQTKRDSQMPV